ncbi:MAG TPA: DEAD/DEAH box helicase [Thermoanaerobaculia bacterium]|nr:DEAD/DEAH box helicase [Thermoanaerobaculia bacterium]
MLAETALRKSISRGSLVRGDAYFAQGRVRRIENAGDVIEAEVQGTRLYSVELIIEGDDLIVRCDCPWFRGNLTECKHIWATIRAASARKWLPEHELFLIIDDELEEFEDDIIEAQLPVPPRGGRHGDARPPWQRFLEALGPASAARESAPRNVPEEIAYVIFGLHRSQTLTLQILGRSHKKSGEWGKWKPLSLRLDELNALPPFDRETIALLHQRSYAYMVESIVHIAPATTAWWVERLARAGRLSMRDGDSELQPIAWDDGPPWVLHAGIVNDAAASKYRVAVSVERAGETMSIERVDAIMQDVLFSGGRACRVDDGGRTAWLHALRTSGPIEIPHADADRFRSALLRAPIANIALPEELGWSVIDAKPKPVLALTHDDWNTELKGELLFDYDEWRVSSRSTEMQTTIGRKLIRRDRSREDGFRGRLGALRIIAVWDGYRVRLPYLEELARTLTAEGWTIEIDSAPVRVADDLDVEISSGIDWFDLNISASFGDLSVKLPELLAAAEAKRSLMRFADGSYGIVPANWNDALVPVLDLGRREGDGVRFRAAQALLIDALLQSKAKTDSAFAELRQRVTGASPAPRHEPPTLRATLRPYQRAGLGWLHFLRETGLGGCLADDMGLGKTVQTLALLEELRANGNTRPSLVVAPRSLLFNWAAEAKRFAPKLRVLEHHGTARATNDFNGCDIVLTTYATMRLDIERLAGTEFEYVVLDEAQAIKNASSQVAKATRLLRARHKLALSGTPIENHLGELWSLFEFLDPGLLGSSRSFSRTFAAKNAPPDRRDALARALRPLILRRTKEQVAPELPERIEQTLYCELEGKQKKQYDELRDHYRQSLLGRVRKGGIEKSRMQILEALLRLRQAACDPALIDPDTDASSAKMELLMEELREVLDSGHRALVFSQFTSFLDIVRGSLEVANIDYLYLDGKTRDRQSLVERFQSGDGPPLFLISLKAGGLGLNLTNADYIFLLDPWWNPAVEAQAIDRAHRIGRHKPVVAYRLIARDTVEEKILELQAQKRELAESIISEDNSVLRKLDVEDLELLLG